MRIGSQEWRFEIGEPRDMRATRYYRATRCGITAPGRSACVASRHFSDSGQGAMLVWSRPDGIHAATRAEAAAAAWKQYADNLMSEHMRAFWQDACRVMLR